MTTSGRVPIGDTGWVRLEGKEAEEFIEAHDKYEANEEALWAMREALLREHPGETVLVTDAGATVQFFPDMAALVAAVSYDELSTGARDLLVERPEILIV